LNKIHHLFSPFFVPGFEGLDLNKGRNSQLPSADINASGREGGAGYRTMVKGFFQAI